MTTQLNQGWIGTGLYTIGLGWLCVCLITTNVSAQSQDLLLPQALQLAHQYYPTLQAKVKSVEIAREGIRLTHTERLPGLRASQQLNYGTANAAAGILLPYGTIIPATGAFTNEPSFRGSFGSSTTLYSQWEPLTFGQYQARLDEARKAVEVATADLANDAFTHQVQTAQVYLELQAVEQYRRVQQQDVERVVTLGRIVERLTQNGLRPGVDTEFANAEIAKAKLALLEALDREEKLRMQLATFMGMAVQSWRLDSTYTALFPRLPLIDSASGITHPQLTLLQQQIGLANARARSLQRSYRPHLALLGGVWARGSGIGTNGIIDRGLGGLPPDRLNYALGIGLTFDILDFSRVRSQVRQQVIQSLSRQDTYRQAKLELSNQLGLASRQLQLVQQKAELIPVQLQAALRAYRQQSLLYNEGLGDLTALTQALYNLRKAETDQLVFTNRAWQTLLSQVAATGNFELFFNAR